MKNSTSKRSAGAQFKLKPTMVMVGHATVGALWAVTAAGNAYAQDAAPAPAAAASAPQQQAQTQQVVVTGIRKGIEDAISVKKNNDNIVEAVSAEDIGKLPDTSVAESLARLPGLTAQQVQGRAQQINVRGMPAEYANGLLNGREVTSTNDSRVVEFDQFPSELLSGVTVYKTPDAALVDQGLAATIDMQTVRPLNFANRVVAGNFRREQLGKGQPGTGTGKKWSLSYIDQFADRKLGVAVGFSRLDDQTGVTQRFDNWGLTTTTTDTGEIVRAQNGFGVFNDQTKRKRDGAMGTLEFRPTKNFSSTLDLFYSKFDFDQSTKGFQAPLAHGDSVYAPASVLHGTSFGAPVDANAPCDLSGQLGHTDGCRTVLAGTYSNVRDVIRNDDTATKDKSVSFGWRNELLLDGGWKLTGDISHSNTKRDQVVLETYAGTTGTAAGADLPLDTITYDISNGARNFSNSLDLTDRSAIKLTDTQGWGGSVPQAGYVKRPHIVDNLNAYRLDAKKDVSSTFFSDFSGGVNFTNRSKSRHYDEAQLVVPGADRYASEDIPGTGTTDVQGFVIPTFDAASQYLSLYNLAVKTDPNIYNKDWVVHEKTTTGYFKADIDSDLSGGVHMGGNVGFQVVHVGLNSDAYNVDVQNGGGAAAQPSYIAVSRSTNDFLPSLNLHWDLGSGNVVRLGVAREMARPNMNDLRASHTIDYSPTAIAGTDIGPHYSASGGNPYLNPYRANSMDLSYEKYFGTKAYVGAAVFYKKLLSYVTPFTYECDLTGQVTNQHVGVADLTKSTCNSAVNGTGGDIEGTELTVSLPFSMAASWLDGFGTQVSYSYTGSSVNVPNSAGGSAATMPMQGLSREVASYTLYFEKWGFSARWNRHTRSDYIGPVTTFTGDTNLTFIQGVPVVDYQVGYDFENGPLKGLGFQFQVDNANNAPYIEYQRNADGTRNVTNYQKFGRTVLFGVNYKF